MVLYFSSGPTPLLDYVATAHRLVDNVILKPLFILIFFRLYKMLGDTLPWKEPTVFHGQMSHCSVLSWKPDQLPLEVREATVKIKIGPKDNKRDYMICVLVLA